MTKNTSVVGWLPLIDPAAAPQPIVEIFKLLPDINLFRVMANGGPAIPGLHEVFGSAVQANGTERGS